MAGRGQPDPDDFGAPEDAADGRAKPRKGLIPRLQRRYATLLRWTLEHRGKSVLGILLIIAVSIVPMMLTKKNMFGGDGGEQVGIYYQWKGSYTKEQMSDEVLRVENFLDAQPQEVPHQADLLVLSASRAMRTRSSTFDSKDAKVTKPLSDALQQGRCRSRRAPTISSATRATTAAAAGQNVAGAAGRRLDADARRTWPTTSCRSSSRRKELRDVRVDAGDRNSELTVHVDRDRAAAFGFSAERRVALRRPGACAARRCANSAAAKPKCRCGCASPAPRTTASRTSPAFTVRAPDGRTVPLLSMVDVQVLPAAIAIKRVNRQTALTITAKLPDKVTHARGAQGDGRHAEGDRVPGRVQLHVRGQRVRRRRRRR